MVYGIRIGVWTLKYKYYLTGDCLRGSEFWSDAIWSRRHFWSRFILNRDQNSFYGNAFWLRISSNPLRPKFTFNRDQNSLLEMNFDRATKVHSETRPEFISWKTNTKKKQMQTGKGILKITLKIGKTVLIVLINSLISYDHQKIAESLDKKSNKRKRRINILTSYQYLMKYGVWIRRKK